jgi:hypothetical protein
MFGLNKRIVTLAVIYSVVFVLCLPVVQIFYVCMFVDKDLGMWGFTQVLDSIIMRETTSQPWSIISSAESSSWSSWNTRHKEDAFIPAMKITELDFRLQSVRKSTIMLDLSVPVLLKGFLNHTSGSDSEQSVINPPWDFDWLKRSPQGDIVVDYVNDARVAFVDGGSVPNTKGTIRSVVNRLEAGDPVKTGTQMIFHTYPDLLYELPLNRLHALFGPYFFPSRVGKMLTVPTFISKGRASSKDDTKQTTRTDLHCEPIANVALQFSGSKKWTLLSPSQSQGLRPALSPDGRAYVYANLPPDDDHIKKLERYEVLMEAGDLLYVPTWWWHRVDYLPDISSFTTSLFHVRFDQMLKHNPLYAAVVFPNLIKELIGWKTQ